MRRAYYVSCFCESYQLFFDYPKAVWIHCVECLVSATKRVRDIQDFVYNTLSCFHTLVSLSFSLYYLLCINFPFYLTNYLFLSIY